VATSALWNPIRNTEQTLLYIHLQNYNEMAPLWCVILMQYLYWSSGKFQNSQSHLQDITIGLSRWFRGRCLLLQIRIEGLRDLGRRFESVNASDYSRWDFRTCRIKKHSENALGIGEWLQEGTKWPWVNYPGLPTSSLLFVGQKIPCPNGTKLIVTFGVS